MEIKNTKRQNVLYALIIAALVLGIVVLTRSLAGDAVRKAGSSLKPVLYGIVIAYLFKPMCNFFYRRFYRLFSKKLSHAKSRKTAHVLSLITTYIIWSAILYFIFTLVLQQVTKSLASVVSSIPSFVSWLTNWVTEQMQNNPILADNTENIIRTVTSAFTSWYDRYLFPTLTNMTNGVVRSFTFIFNLLVGFIVSVYLLHTRKKLGAQARLIVKGLFNKKSANSIFDEAKFADSMFSGFFVGKLIDSAIVGAVCYVACLVMRTPYAELVSVIVAITNVIPFFGPYIGMVPSAVIILTVSPFHALTFLIMDWLLQQIDGNILGPKIIGNNTGLSSFWVLFSILLFGGIFGFFGMLIGVPVFAVIHDISAKFIRSCLHKRGEGDSISDYEKEFLSEEKGGRLRKKDDGEEKEERDDAQISFDTEQDAPETSADVMEGIGNSPENVDYTEQEDLEQVKFF